MMRVVKILGCVVLLALVAGSAQATIVVNEHGVDGVVIADAFLNWGAPDSNYGGSGFVQASSYPEPNPTAKATVIRVLSPNIPAGQTIVSATLRLMAIEGFGWNDQDASGDITLDIAPLLVPFVETEVTGNDYSLGNAWNTLLARGVGTDRGAVESTTTYTPPAAGFGHAAVDWDVSVSFAQQYATGNYYGWVIDRVPVDNDGSVSLRDRDVGVPSLRPVLIVEYIPEPATLGLLGLGMLLTVLRRRAR